MKHREVIEAEAFLNGMTGVAPRDADALVVLQDACGHIENLLALWKRQQEAEKVYVCEGPNCEPYTVFASQEEAELWNSQGEGRDHIGTYLKQLEATDE